MVNVPRRRNQLTVAIPASFTQDIPHIREKTARVGYAARSLTMFRVDSVIIYQDRIGVGTEKEGTFLEKILRYHETPQYLRKYVFKKDPDLQYAGTLPPLRAPHHPNAEAPAVGQLREGIVSTSGPISTVNAGYSQLVHVNGRLVPSKRLTVRITHVGPRIEAEIVDRSELTIYWGPRFSRENRTLGQVVKGGKHDMTISTSRRGADVRHVMDQLQQRWKSAKRTLLLFGSPREGVPDILAREHVEVSELSYNINTIPQQAVETVRTEEALHATLAILNTLGEV